MSFRRFAFVRSSRAPWSFMNEQMFFPLFEKSLVFLSVSGQGRSWLQAPAHGPGGRETTRRGGEEAQATGQEGLYPLLLVWKYANLPSLVELLSYFIVPHQKPFFAVFRIHDILVWIRILIRIRGSMLLTNGSGFGSGSWYFRHWPSRRQQKTYLKKSFSAYSFFEGTFTSKIKSLKEVTKQ